MDAIAQATPPSQRSADGSGHFMCYGTVAYERGIEVVEVQGWMVWEGPWLVVFGNPDLPVLGQRHTAIPVNRVVETDCHESRGC